METNLVFDFGGTSLRAGLIDASGSLVASQTRPSTAGQAPTADPQNWWAALVELSDALAAQVPQAFAATKAVAISAFTRSQVFVDAAGEIAHPALLWHDTRAETVVDAMRLHCAADDPEFARLNAFHPAARLYWLKQHAPAALARTRFVLEPKDYLNFRLTGVASGDFVSSARLAAAVGGEPSSIFSALGLPRHLLPVLRDPVEIMGRVAPGGPGALALLAGVPVVAMANDTWAAVAGIGALRSGAAYNISGTTEVLGLVAERALQAEGLLDVIWGAALHQLGGPGQNGADILAWALDLLGRGDADRDAVLALPRAAAPVLFLPYLQGERTPWWDANLRGALLGLDRRHKPVDILYAAMEGLAFLNRIVLTRAEAAAGRRAEALHFGGGGAANAVWAQIKADILDRPVFVPPVEAPGLLGAAIAASVATGRYPSLDAAQTALVPPGRRYVPDASKRAHYDALFAVFEAAHQALAPVSRRLAAWPTSLR